MHPLFFLNLNTFFGFVGLHKYILCYLVDLEVKEKLPTFMF